MDTKTFLENFGTIAEAPGGIGQLRGLVLKLGLSGALQNPVEFPREEWVILRLDEVARLEMGLTILRSDLGPTGVPVYSAGQENRRWGFVENPTRKYERGSLVLSARGSLGFPKIPNESEFISTQTTIAIIPRRIDAEFLCLSLRAVDWAEMGSGGAIPMLTIRKVSAVQISVPPLAEQKRIVAKVDELMALCDELEEKQQRKATVTTKLRGSGFNALRQAETPDDLAAAWERISTNWSHLTNHPDSIPELRQTIFDLATSGCLSSHQADDGFGAEVVSESQVGRKRKLGLTLGTPPSRKGLGLPETWIWSDLDSLCVTQTGATPAKEETDSSGVPRIAYVSPAQIDSGVVIETNKVAHTTLIKRTAGPGSLLFVGIGGSIGKVGVCAQEVTFNQQIHAASPIIADSRYLWIALSSTPFQLETKIRTSATAIPIINKSKWESIPIPVPPLAEQKRIVAKVDELMALCDELENQLQYQQDLSSRLAIASTRLAF